MKSPTNDLSQGTAVACEARIAGDDRLLSVAANPSARRKRPPSPATNSPHRIGALDWISLALIRFYQRHLSPRKGYRCAYARLHGGWGCSGFAREAIAAHGICAAWPQIRARFAQCKSAARTLRAQVDFDKPKKPTNGKKEPDKRKSRSDKCDSCWPNWNWPLCCDMAIDCGPRDTGCCDCTPCDWN